MRNHPTQELNERVNFECLGHSNWTICSPLSPFCSRRFITFSVFHTGRPILITPEGGRDRLFGGCPATVHSMCVHANTTIATPRPATSSGNGVPRNDDNGRKERGRNERTDEAASGRALDTLVTHANGLPASASQHGMSVV